jgi:hypothetical protein
MAYIIKSLLSSNTNIITSQIVEANTLNITRMPEPIVMRLGMYIMPPEAISTAYLISLLSVVPTLQPLKSVEVNTPNIT